MKIRVLLLLTCLFLWGAVVTAQVTGVTGIVTSEEDGLPVIGASVMVKGTTIGVATDMDGKFTLSNLPSTAKTLEISFIGMETQEVAIKANLNIVLKPDIKQLEEIMVVAYGTSTKSSFTGSASMVKSEKIEKLVTTNVTSALAGTTPSIQIISNSGDPTSNGNTIRIRGIGSMSASSSPLIILDGMPYDGAISDINPNDIASMSVLKDASASAIYGARGANGVILITTKKGSENNLPNVKFEMRLGSNSRLVPQYDVITDPAEYYETYYRMMYNSQYYAGKSVATSYAYANKNLFDEANGGLGYRVFTVPEGQNLIGTNFKINPNAKLGYSDGTYYYTPDNWYDIVYHDSFRQEYNLSISGSSNKLSYYASAGYLDDGGVVNNSNYKRYTARLNAEYQAKTWMKFITNVGFSHSDSQSPSYNPDIFGSSGNIFYICNNIGPIYPLYVRDKNGNIMTESGRTVYDANQTNFKRPGFVGNAVRDNEYNRSQSYADVLTGKLGAVLTPVTGLTISGNLGLMSDNTRANTLYSQFASYSSIDGATAVSHGRNFTLNSQALAEYKTVFGDSHHIDVLAGYERYTLKYQSLSGYNERLFDPFIGELANAGATLPKQAQSYTTNYMTEGFLSRVQYDYDQRYYVSASYRRDASSRFAKGHRWGNFGSLGVAWDLSAEEFLNDVKWIDLLKVKASWGAQGNDNIGGYFPYSDQYVHSYNEESKEYSVNLTYKGNEDLTWETSHAFNVGVDFEFFGRMNGSLEFFDRITTDMLFNKPVPLSAGNPTGHYPINVGSMSNVGFELAVDGTVVRTKHLEWNLNLNLTSYKNKIRSLDPSVAEEGIKGGQSIIKVGGPMYNAYLRKFAGVNHKTGEALYYYKMRDDNGKETGKIDTTTDFTKADQFELGTVLPKLFGGFGSTLTVYGFDLSLQFAFQLGGKYYDGSYQALMHTQANPGQNMHKDLLKSWTPENPDSDYPRLDGNTLVGQTGVDRFLVSSNYLNLNNIQIGYTLPKKTIQRLPIGSLRVYLAGENVILLTARKGIDPRTSLGMGGYASGSGLNTGGYSNMRNITGGISVTF